MGKSSSQHSILPSPLACQGKNLSSCVVEAVVLCWVSPVPWSCCHTSTCCCYAYVLGKQQQQQCSFYVVPSQLFRNICIFIGALHFFFVTAVFSFFFCVFSPLAFPFVLLLLLFILLFSFHAKQAVPQHILSSAM